MEGWSFDRRATLSRFSLNDSEYLLQLVEPALRFAATASCTKASATISARVVSGRTADRALCRFVHRLACA